MLRLSSPVLRMFTLWNNRSWRLGGKTWSSLQTLVALVVVWRLDFINEWNVQQTASHFSSSNQFIVLFFYEYHKKISGFVWDISFSMAAASESRKGCRRTCWSTRWDWGGIGCGRKAHTPSLDTILLLYLHWLWLLLVFSYKRCRFDHASQRPAFNIKFQYKLFLVKPLMPDVALVLSKFESVHICPGYMHRTLVTVKMTAQPVEKSRG